MTPPRCLVSTRCWRCSARIARPDTSSACPSGPATVQGWTMPRSTRHPARIWCDAGRIDRDRQFGCDAQPQPAAVGKQGHRRHRLGRVRQVPAGATITTGPRPGSRRVPPGGISASSACQKSGCRLGRVARFQVSEENSKAYQAGRRVSWSCPSGLGCHLAAVQLWPLAGRQRGRSRVAGPSGSGFVRRHTRGSRSRHDWLQRRGVASG